MRLLGQSQLLYCVICDHLLDNHVGGCPACLRDRGRDCHNGPWSLREVQNAYHIAGIDWLTGMTLGDDHMVRTFTTRAAAARGRRNKALTVLAVVIAALIAAAVLVTVMPKKDDAPPTDQPSNTVSATMVMTTN